ncbi:MAG: gliding motility-associated C-terminal domain-containing protein [Bacteroidetes bacterium]|nr:gliding motility-associated C-terminal domain-containing protein [Bacteroidota bacterium]
MIRIVLLFCFLMLSLSAWCTHNRSGEITYEYVNGNTYRFFVTTCTKLTSAANRNTIEINYGDGFTDTISLIQFFDFPSTDTKQNIFSGIHTFSGPGIYTISITDPNRNNNVLNIVNSVNEIFCIQTELIISPFLGKPNNSLLFGDCPCPEEACFGQEWIYALGCYDPDNDSLAYEIIGCKGQDCKDMPIPDVFQFPQDVGGGTFSIDPQFGIISWNAPNLNGEFNFAIKVSEYRNGVKIGHVIRDMQVTVKGNCSNNPPQLAADLDTCLQADSTLIIDFQATDNPASPSDIPELSWSFYGLPFNFSSNPAQFQIISNNSNPIDGQLTWTPNCGMVQDEPYLLTIQAEDKGPIVSLKGVQKVKIRVIGTPVQNVNVAASLNQATINWNSSICNSVTGYVVYRKSDSTYISDTCCSFSPTELGYKKIGEISGRNNTLFFDNGPLVTGNRYCYTVTAVYPSGTESCLAIPNCVELPFDVPIITKVSIDSTSLTHGNDSIQWKPPIELDTLLFTGPYSYTIYRASGSNFPVTPIFTTPTFPYLIGSDSLYIDTLLNTREKSYSYIIELKNNDVAVGKSSYARSIFVETIPNDNQIALQWIDNTPWINHKYEVYRSSSAFNNSFSLLASVDTSYYLDDSLVNGMEYCYRIKSYGTYSHPDLSDTLINWSQIICSKATDNTKPCPVSGTSLTADCENATLKFTWIPVDTNCADDVVSYQIYQSKSKGEEFQQIAKISAAGKSEFIYSDFTGLVGCFFITAMDSMPYNNESLATDTICIENCDVTYNLPNVFTPNSDQINGWYHAIFPIKYVEKVEFRIFNRWGEELFYTEAPEINWDGIDRKTNLPLLEGVYFYSCKVFTRKLSGITSFDLSGFIHLIRN